MQHRGLAVIERRKRAIDGGGKFIRLSDAFTVRAECLGDLGKITPFALAARH